MIPLYDLCKGALLFSANRKRTILLNFSITNLQKGLGHK